MPRPRAISLVGYPLAALCLGFWAYMTFLGPGWGWVHLFLIFGMVLLYWRIVQSDAPARR